MKPAEEFLKEKGIKTFGAIICDGQQLVELLEEYVERVAKTNSFKNRTNKTFLKWKTIIKQLIDESPTLKALCNDGTVEFSGGLCQIALEDFAEKLVKNLHKSVVGGSLPLSEKEKLINKFIQTLERLKPLVMPSGNY